MNGHAPQTVSELNRSIKRLLENSFSYVTVIGEISNVRRPYSGHLYFSLKDNTSQLKSVLFKMQQRYLQGELKNGQQVICKGRISLYEPRGEYQLIIDTLEFVGSGALQLAFERLKTRLLEEGLFDSKAKKNLPFMPHKIAVITSPQGAAVQDFLHIAGIRCPSIPIDIYPVSVQGEQAAPEAIEAIETINKHKGSDIIVLCRGGGSLEDLWSFNDENLARAIFASSIPIVSAIGHEIDFTIADFVADLRAPTPTAAAGVVMPDYREIQKRIAISVTSISRGITAKIMSYSERVAYQRRLLHTPIRQINNQQLRVAHLNDRSIQTILFLLERTRLKTKKAFDRLAHCNPANQLEQHRVHVTRLRSQLQMNMNHILTDKGQKVSKSLALLKAVNPLAILDRGYSIVKSLPTQKIIKSSENVKRGDRLEIILSHGEIQCEVVD